MSENRFGPKIASFFNPVFMPLCVRSVLFECLQIILVINARSERIFIIPWNSAGCSVSQSVVCGTGNQFILYFFVIWSKRLLIWSSHRLFLQLNLMSLFCRMTPIKELLVSTHTLIFLMSHVSWLSFVFVCVVVFFAHSNCSEIWGLSTPNTIEQWDTSGLYSYPDQTRWLCFTSYEVLLLTASMWESCCYNVGDDRRRHVCFAMTQSTHICYRYPTWPYCTSWPPIHTHIFCCCLSAACHHHLLFLFNQITTGRWPLARLPQEGASPCYLLPLVAMAGPSQPPRATRHRSLWVRLPSQEGWGLHQPLPLPEGGDSRWEECDQWVPEYKCMCR